MVNETIAELEEKFVKAENEYRMGMDKEIERLLKLRAENDGDAVTLGLYDKYNPIAWTMEDGDIHTICSVVLCEYDGEVYNSLYIETESECGGGEFDIIDLDTELISVILNAVSNINMP